MKRLGSILLLDLVADGLHDAALLLLQKQFLDLAVIEVVGAEFGQFLPGGLISLPPLHIDLDLPAEELPWYGVVVGVGDLAEEVAVGKGLYP